MNTTKIALFDVDKTLIHGDSMFYLLKYTIKKKPYLSFHLPVLFVKLLGYKAKIITTTKAKESMFYTLNYLCEGDLSDFFNTMIKPKIYKDALNKIKDLKSKGYYILLISASPECYLKYFENEDFIDGVIGTKFEFINGRFINKISGLNCKGEEKVSRINTFLQENDLIIDKENSVAYSDSLSDTPMFSLVKNAYLINSKNSNHEYEILKWK